MTIRIEAFPAGYGDSLLVSYGSDESPTRILIDGGLAGSATYVVRRLNELDADVDLFVITHIDVDHIAGAVRLLSNKAFTKRLGAVWFNGRVHLEQYNDLLGALDGERVGNLLAELGLPWNAGWAWRNRPEGTRAEYGGPVVMGEVPLAVEMPGGARATLLSPTKDKLTKLLPEWRDTIRAAGLVKDVPAHREAPDPAPRVLLGEPTLGEVARTRTVEDDKAPNGSSIAFVLEVPEQDSVRRILLTGDAHPGLLTTGLSQLQDGEAPYRVDVCKLPHHGSRRNVTEAFIASLSCSKWIVSTNGKAFHHPNDEALARIVVGHPGSTIYGNYTGNIPLASFDERYPPAQHCYTLVQPGPLASGITVPVND